MDAINPITSITLKSVELAADELVNAEPETVELAAAAFHAFFHEGEFWSLHFFGSQRYTSEEKAFLIGLCAGLHIQDRLIADLRARLQQALARNTKV